MEFFTPVFNYITDSNKNLSFRALMVLITVLSILFIDNMLGFSYYYNVSKKVEIINNIDKSLKDSISTTSDKVLLVRLKDNVLKHQSLKDKIWDFLANRKWDEKLAFNSLINMTFFVTASSFSLFFMIATFIVAIMQLFKKKNPIIDDDNFTVIIKTTGIEFICYVLAIFEVKGFSLIPPIFNIIYINFALNIFINFLFLYCFYLIINISKPKRKT